MAQYVGGRILSSECEHDGHALGVDGAEVGVLKGADQVDLARLLQTELWKRRSVLKSWAISRTRR